MAAAARATAAVGEARVARGVRRACVHGTAPQRWRTTAAAAPHGRPAAAASLVTPHTALVTPYTALVTLSAAPPSIAPWAAWAADAPTNVMPPLFDSIGGNATVQATVDLFYTKVSVDPELSRFFKGVDIKRLRGHQVSFLTQAFGGPNKYNGGTIALALRKMIEQQGLSKYHFDIVVGHLVACLKKLSVDQSHIDEVVAIVLTLREAFPDPKLPERQETWLPPFTLIE